MSTPELDNGLEMKIANTSLIYPYNIVGHVRSNLCHEIIYNYIIVFEIRIQSGSLIVNPLGTKNLVHNIETSY